MLFPAAAVVVVEEEEEEEEDALPLPDVDGGSDGASFGVGGKKRGFSIASAGFALELREIQCDGMTRACVADWDATGCREELTRTGFGIGREVCLEKVYNEGQAPSLGCGARPRSLGGRGVSKWSREQNEMRYEPVPSHQFHVQWGEDGG